VKFERLQTYLLIKREMLFMTSAITNMVMMRNFEAVSDKLGVAYTECVFAQRSSQKYCIIQFSCLFICVITYKPKGQL
jgi:hypothetical protein